MQLEIPIVSIIIYTKSDIRVKIYKKELDSFPRQTI